MLGRTVRASLPVINHFSREPVGMHPGASLKFRALRKKIEMPISLLSGGCTGVHPYTVSTPFTKPVVYYALTFGGRRAEPIVKTDRNTGATAAQEKT